MLKQILVLAGGCKQRGNITSVSGPGVELISITFLSPCPLHCHCMWSHIWNNNYARRWRQFPKFSQDTEHVALNKGIRLLYSWNNSIKCDHPQLPSHWLKNQCLKTGWSLEMIRFWSSLSVHVRPSVSDGSNLQWDGHVLMCRMPCKRWWRATRRLHRSPSLQARQERARAHRVGTPAGGSHRVAHIHNLRPLGVAGWREMCATKGRACIYRAVWTIFTGIVLGTFKGKHKTISKYDNTVCFL